MATSYQPSSFSLRRNPHLRWSLLVHGLFFCTLILFHLLQDLHWDIEIVPLELTEFTQKMTDVKNTTPVKKASKSNSSTPPAPSTTNSNPALTSSNPTPQNNSENQTADGESVQEEYAASDMPILLNETKIEYPPDAKVKGIQGAVLFDLVVNKDGKVEKVTLISSPDPSLTAAAEPALRKFKFRPAKLNNKPVAIRIRYSYRFVLQ